MATGVEEHVAARCPNCGAPHDPYQEYCLECGRRLPSPFYAARRREVWSTESPLWLAGALLALLLVALGGTAFAIWATGDEPETVTTQTVAGAEPIPGPTTATVPPATTIAPPTEPQATLPTVANGPPPPPATSPIGASLIQWPSGQEGFTVVIMSVPTAQGRDRAEEAARRALDAGLTEVGVLNSSNFGTLRPGFYVAFTGIHNTLAEAQTALPDVRNAGFPLAYVREIGA